MSGDAGTCCLLENGRRCTNPATQTNFTDRYRRVISHHQLPMAVSEKASHYLMCAAHRDLLNAYAGPKVEKRKRATDEPEPEVNFNALHMNTLKRYRKHFELDLHRNLSKGELVELVTEHFRQQEVSEDDTIQLFIHTVKTKALQNKA